MKTTPSRARSLSASNAEHGAVAESSQREELSALKDQLIKLEAEKKELEAKVTELVEVSKESKDKSELVSAERKARQYVRDITIADTIH